ncbi:flavin reductase family protein [Arundinibacter roseus]|uniref:Flavin reductase family protein n=1 Tax=Arundinibacter roseus TaxID=2070510 RepID=A0A4R4KGX0_9BACT|nr:flavin reductase family protein [Arundinibacter roseus]TDB65851.1 flavin reductase family protein [Arundinibacter roseus]
MKTINPSDIGPRSFYSYMTTAVAPRPIAFASTVDAQGQVNLSPFSFFNYVGIEPPLVVFAPGKRSRDQSYKDTALNLFEVPEVVINMVTYAIIQQMSLTSAEFERGVNEFEKAGLTMLPSELVKPPRVAESPAQFECKVVEIKEIGSMVLVIAEVVRAHFDESILNEKGFIDQSKTDWVARMGGDWYARASGEAIFEIPRPQHGIGVDALPESVRQSRILTGNDLGRLGSLKIWPEEAVISAYGTNPAIQDLRQEAQMGCQYWPDLLHNHARQLLQKDQVVEALLTLLQESR